MSLYRVGFSGCWHPPLTLIDIVTRFHKTAALQDFFEQNIDKFLPDSSYTIEIEAIWTLPRFKCQLYEFTPLQNPDGHMMALKNGRFQQSRPKSIPLALSQTSNLKHSLMPFEQYLQQLINDNLDDFANICYTEMEDPFMDKLLHLLVKYKGRDPKEVSFISTALPAS
jgi:hypothetical protein